MKGNLKARRRRAKDLWKQQLFREIAKLYKEMTGSECVHAWRYPTAWVVLKPRIKVQLVEPTLSTGKWGEVTPNTSAVLPKCSLAALVPVPLWYGLWAQLQNHWDLPLTALGCMPQGHGVRVQLGSPQIAYHLKMICNNCICLSLTVRDEPL